ncbi:MAG: hypothetical protein P8P74_12880 [Crocinitomicaceae bacterium]|nr:hypothetical protein [Crocinitomicaceae bacterium]
MKEPIEELFKQSLQGHEMPYNPEAWKAMSARLDVASPVAKPTSYLRYYLGAAGIGAVAVASYFIFAGGTPEETKVPVAKETTLEQTTADTTKPSIGNSDAQKGNTSVISNPSETPISQDEGSQGSSVDQGNTQTNTNQGTSTNVPNETTNQSNTTTTSTQSNGANGNSGTQNNVNHVPADVPAKMTIPAVEDLCLNEEATISNPNNKEIYIIDAVGNIMKTIPANKAVVFKPSTVGNYSLGYKNDGTIESSSNFIVNRIPDAAFTVDLANKYENGLPVTYVAAINGEGTYTWTAEKQSSNGVETDLHFYNKGDKTITLTVNNGQCEASVEKTIYVEEDYNLMAVNAFTPTSVDPRNQTFMPFALTQRADVNFVLTIIDGRDGGVVYQTNDASLPWDGTDIRSGRRSETPQVYVWKAVISNPAANEPNEYRGTITMN